MKNKRLMKIINGVDIFGNRFVPSYQYYEVVYTHDKYVALGFDHRVLYCVSWDNVEDFWKIFDILNKLLYYNYAIKQERMFGQALDVCKRYINMQT